MALYNPLLIKKLSAHLKKDPGSKSFCVLAQIYFSMGEAEKAEKLCLEGLAHNPSYSPAYLILSGIYKKQGLMEKALQFLNKAKALNPDNPSIYKSLGEIYKKQNDMDKTLESYKMVAFLRPGDKTAIATIRHLEKMRGQPAPPEEDKASQAFPSESLSERDTQKLAKLNKILALVDMFLHQQS